MVANKSFTVLHRNTPKKISLKTKTYLTKCMSQHLKNWHFSPFLSNGLRYKNQNYLYKRPLLSLILLGRIQYFQRGSRLVKIKRSKNERLKEAKSGNFELVWSSTKLSLKETLKQFAKIKKEIMINHKGTRMVKDGEVNTDYKWMQSLNLKHLGQAFKDAQIVT